MKIFAEQMDERQFQPTEASASVAKRGCLPSCWEKWLLFAAKFHESSERFFYRYGFFISGHPIIVMSMCVIFTGAVGWGLGSIKIESRTEKLYVPVNSRAERDLKDAEKYYTIQTRVIKIILTRKDRGNILAKDTFRYGLETMNGIVNNTGIEKVCIKGGATYPFINAETAMCMRTDPFELFSYSMAEVLNGSVETKINMLFQNHSYLMRNGRPLSASIDAMFGGIKTDVNGEITSAEALRISFPTTFPKTDEKYEQVLQWETEFLKYIAQVKDQLSAKGIDVFFFTFKSIDDSINESTSGDILLISITFTIMCSFTCFSLGRFRNLITGHGTAGMVGIFVVAMGIVSSFGFLLICGVTFLATIGILPFLILGIAIDDMFIILDELDRADFRLPTREIIANVIGRIGGSVTMTTLTDLVAFAVSTTSAFPAIRYFCAYAAAGLMFSYMMIMTFFVAYLVFEVNRIKKGRYDMLPCLRNVNFKADEETGLIVSPKLQFSTFVMNMLGRCVTNNVGRIFVICASIGLLAAGVVGSLGINETFTLKMLGKDGSEYIQFLDTETKYFSESVAVSIVVPGSFGLDKQENQMVYSSLVNQAIGSHHLMLNKSINWLDEFQRWAYSTNRSTIGSQFQKSLLEFLSIPRFAQFSADLVFSSDKQDILASRVIVFMKNSLDSTRNKDAMLNLREAIDKHSTIKVYAAAFQFLYFEQYVLVVPETTRNVIICGLTVLLMTAPFLLNPGILLLMVLSFGALIFELLGLMAVWNVSLNSISMIILTMAIGFCVDYSAHVAHAYVISDVPDAKSGIVGALTTTGASVLMGGFSTFLGMLVTGFASSEIFRIFFKMFLGIVALGLLHGLVILPTFIGVFNISRVAASKEGKNDNAVQILENKIDTEEIENGRSPSIENSMDL